MVAKIKKLRTPESNGRYEEPNICKNE